MGGAAGPWAEYVESHRAMKRERDGDCICDHNPETTDGPDEYCPWHGRTYSEWIERVEILAGEVESLRDEVDGLQKGYAAQVSHGVHLRSQYEALRAKLARVEALADDYQHLPPGGFHGADAARELRHALTDRHGWRKGEK